MKPISQDIRNDIITLINNGHSIRQVAKQLGIHYSTVSRVRRDNSCNVKKSRGGRPSKLTATDKRRVVRMITSGEVDTATQAKQQLCNAIDTNISTKTVVRELKKAGMKATTKQKKPLLLSRHIRQRLEFAKKYQHWTLDDWKRVIWSDETKINRLGCDGRIWIWKKPGEPLVERHIKPTVKFGGGSLMIWGCMTAKGVGYMCRVDGNMDAQLYTNILNDELLRTLDYYHLARDDIVFQHDNDPKHTSRMATNWLNENDIEVLDWPPQSPDLNPIEHLWCHLKRKLAGYEDVATSMHELWKRVEAEWETIPTEGCMNLIESMTNRVAAVLKASGGYTKY
jgi:transposase